MVFYYALHWLIYSHDIDSYYRWFISRPWEKQSYHSSVHYLSCVRLDCRVEAPQRLGYFVLIEKWVYTFFIFNMDPLCIVRGHAFLLLSMGLLASGRYHMFEKFTCLTCRCFYNSCVHKPSFSIMPWSLKSINKKIIRMK